MSDNILDQLRNKRNRPTVTPRQDALLRREQPQAQPQEQNSLPQTTPVTELANSTAAPSDTLAELKAELEKYPQTRRHSAIVLEKDLDQELTRFCKELGITVEVFLEAAWTVASADNAQLEKITTEAKRRYDQRKRVGHIKRLITMLSNPSK
ncbi:hypothetical protein [Nostoc sp.]|uniref:hypothetical protein n=1 Tax=Nostoc sp. TaxID=1180 RepID=UPI002FFAD6A2